MEQTFAIARTSRKMIAGFLEKYSTEQLNTIPANFNNNLIWNIAHIIVTQQLLVYKFSGIPMLISDEFVEKYRKGTKVEGLVSENEVEQIKLLLNSTIDQTEIDFANGLFKNYSEYPTSTGYVIISAESAMEFNNFHEGIHLGVMMSIKKGL